MKGINGKTDLKAEYIERNDCKISIRIPNQIENTNRERITGKQNENVRV